MSSRCAVSLFSPGCERTFITVSALFSHNRAHFREQEQFSCSFPGCNKQYDKACRLKIHMRSHTGIHRDDLYTGRYMEHRMWKVDFIVLEKLKVRKGDINYLESVKAFDSWPSGRRNPLNRVVIYKVVKDMQSRGFHHCTFCPEKTIPALFPSSWMFKTSCKFYSQYKQAAKTSQSMWNVCTNQQEDKFQLWQAHLTCKNHCKAEMQPCHVTGVPSTVRSFPGFMVLQFLIFFKVSLEIHQCDGN